MTRVNVKWKVLMGSDWWSRSINSSWAVWWNALTYPVGGVSFPSDVQRVEGGGKKKKKREDVSYLVWRIIGGSAPCLSSSDRKSSDSCQSMSRSPIYGWLLAEGDWSPAVCRRFNDGFAALLALIGREGANSSFRYGSIKVKWCLGWKTGSLQQKKPECKKTEIMQQMSHVGDVTTLNSTFYTLL